MGAQRTIELTTIPELTAFVQLNHRYSQGFGRHMNYSIAHGGRVRYIKQRLPFAQVASLSSWFLCSMLLTPRLF